MIKITGYHGTTSIKCSSIVSTNTWIPSKGIHHWLGDGVYFFGVEKEAIGWVSKYGDEAALIEADIVVEDIKLFDLDIPAKLRVFLDEAKRILDNIEYHDVYIDNKHKIDGYVLNFIYDNFYQFHVVKRKFYFYPEEFDIYREKYHTSVTRFMQDQVQYCVRECTCIVQVREKVIT